MGVRLGGRFKNVPKSKIFRPSGSGPKALGNGGHLFLDLENENGDEFIYKLKTDDLSKKSEYNGTLLNAVWGGDNNLYNYFINNSGEKFIYKIKPSDMSIIESKVLNDGAYPLWGGDGNIYLVVTIAITWEDNITGESKKKWETEVRKLNPSDLSDLTSYYLKKYVYSIEWGGDGYLYIGATTVNDDIASSDSESVVYKIDPSTMIEQATYNNHRNGVEIVNMMWGEDEHIYAGTHVTLHKINPSDMSKVSEYNGVQPNHGRSLVWGNNGYLYIGGRVYIDNNKEYEIHKINPSDLSTVSKYKNHNQYVGTLEFDANGYLYSLEGTANETGMTLNKIDPSDMSKVSSIVESNMYMVDIVSDITKWDRLGWTLDSNGVVTSYG